MAKSKMVEINEKIADKVTGGFQKIEDGVTTGYKKIEEGVVGGFNKMVDGFVDHFLTCEGETVEEARVRLAQEQEQREAAVKADMEKRAEQQRKRIEQAQELGRVNTPHHDVNNK